MRLGPVTIMRSRTHDAYRRVVAEAWRIHRVVWWGDLTTERSQREIIDADAKLSAALSYVPAEDEPQ